MYTYKIGKLPHVQWDPPMAVVKTVDFPLDGNNFFTFSLGPWCFRLKYIMKTNQEELELSRTDNKTTTVKNWSMRQQLMLNQSMAFLEAGLLWANHNNVQQCLDLIILKCYGQFIFLKNSSQTVRWVQPRAVVIGHSNPSPGLFYTILFLFSN